MFSNITKLFCCRVLRWLGEAVFTVVILENILRREFSKLFDNYNIEYLPSIWVTLMTVFVGLIIGMIVKRIPFIQKIL